MAVVVVVVAVVWGCCVISCGGDDGGGSSGDAPAWDLVVVDVVVDCQIPPLRVPQYMALVPWLKWECFLRPRYAKRRDGHDYLPVVNTSNWMGIVHIPKHAIVVATFAFAVRGEFQTSNWPRK